MRFMPVGQLIMEKRLLSQSLKLLNEAFNINLGNPDGSFTQNMLLRKESCSLFEKINGSA